MFSQITGGFYFGKYTNGSSYIYFKGINVSGYNLQINICATNEIQNQRRDWNLFLLAGNSFTISPNDGWSWIKGEKLWVQYSNGATGYWVNSLSLASSSPSFRGSLHCTLCNCKSWGGGSNYNSVCPNPGCRHSYVKHYRPGD